MIRFGVFLSIQHYHNCHSIYRQINKTIQTFRKAEIPISCQIRRYSQRSIRSVAFKPPLGGADTPKLDFLDLPALAAGSFDSTISVWGIDEPDVEYDIEEVIANQKEILTSPNNEWNLMAIIEGHENEVKAVDWNFQGQYLALFKR